MTDPRLRRDLAEVLERTRDVWPALANARIFVTGGTGFVGTWLLEALVAANQAHDLRARAVVLTRDPGAFARRSPHLAADAAIELLRGDAGTFEAPPGAYTHVVHAATERAFDADARRPLSIVEPDLHATRRVLELARERGAGRVLFTSSGAVYGRQPPDLAAVPETYAGAPDVTDARSAYGESKRLSEFAFTSYGRTFGFAAVIARLFAFVGPHLPLDANYAAGNFVRDALAGGPIAVGGDGTPFRSYLYAADLAAWLWTLLVRGEGGRAYNVGSSDAVSIAQLAAHAAALVPGARVEIAQRPVPGAPAARYVPDVTRAEHELGLRAWTSLDESIARTYAFHHANRRTPAPL